MIKANLNRALGRFGENLEVVRQSGNADVKGKIGRVLRVTNPWAMRYLKQAVFSAEVEINSGEIIHNKEEDIYYFAYVLQKNYKGTTLHAFSINLLIADSLCEIQRLQGTQGAFGGTKQTFSSQKTDIRSHLREVTADLRTERPALLERVSFLLYMQNSEDLQILDRVVIDSIDYQVEHINKTILAGLFETQLSLDRR